MTSLVSKVTFSSIDLTQFATWSFVDICDFLSTFKPIAFLAELTLIASGLTPKHLKHNNLVIPLNCATWNDGCNTCQVNQDGTFGACTLMYCFTQNTPSCTSYYRTENSCQSNSDCDENKFYYLNNIIIFKF